MGGTHCGNIVSIVILFCFGQNRVYLPIKRINHKIDCSRTSRILNIIAFSSSTVFNHLYRMGTSFFELLPSVRIT